MFVRARFTSTTEQDHRFYFDLIVDDGYVAAAELVYFGFFGSLAKADQGHGVILLPAGFIDFGEPYLTDQRYWQTNIHERAMRLGEYVTVWEKGDAPSEATYRIDAITDLSFVKSAQPFQPTLWKPSAQDIPQFRARTIQHIDIKGYDRMIYRPPIGTLGYVARVQTHLVFYPDNAVAKNRHMIDVCVNADDIELLNDVDNLHIPETN